MKNKVPYRKPEIARNKGVEIVYDAFGEPGGRPLLLIMGLGEQMITWREDLCTRLAGQGFFVIRFDNRDIGLSTKFHDHGMPNLGVLALKRMLKRPVQAPYTLSDMAGDAAAVLDALGLASAIVMGASMGGMIGQVMALEHPHRVERLISVISAPGVFPNFSAARRYLSALGRFLPLGGNGARPLSPAPAALQFLVKPSPAQREQFADYYVNLGRIINGGRIPLDMEEYREHALALFDRGLCRPGLVRQLAAIIGSPDRTAALKTLRRPTLVIHGEQDPLLPLEMGVETARLIPNARLKVMPHMGHWLPRGVWSELMEAINDFVLNPAL